MAKKVFKIIGIVLGAVMAFTGAVVGVLAIMGKFKTPDVYPDVLQFENEIRVVDKYLQLNEYNNNDSNPDNDMFSFVLTGTNTNEDYAEYEVNKTTCYLWFVDNVGKDLITLCDSNGNALVAESDGRYKVECNTPIYYKVNSLISISGGTTNVDSTINAQDGKVQLRARHENENAQSNILTIWIDRKINSVSVLDSTTSATNASGKYEQTIQVGTDIRRDITYIINPEKSLAPISKESAKIIELYFNNEGKATDYILVTEESVQTNEDLNNLIKYDEDQEKFYFYSSTAGTYNFIIATFPTYAAKEEFDADPANANLTNYQRVKEMLTTNLTVKVVNSNVSSVVLNQTYVALDLYATNNYITLNSNGISDADAKNNNLEMVVYKENEPTDILYDNAQFGGYTARNVTTSSLNYLDSSDNLYTYAEMIEKETGKTFNELFTKSNITISASVNGSPKELTLLNNVGDYRCESGVLAVDSSNNYYIVDSGLFLDFYVYDSGANTYTLASETDFSYSLEYVSGTAGANKTWQIIAKSLIESGVDLRLGVLVINSNGEFNATDFFKTASVTVSEHALSYEIVTENSDLSVSFAEGEAEPFCDEISLKDLITNISGSYNSLVFGVKITETCNVEVLIDPTTGDKLTVEINGEDYYIVGYYDSNNKFINNVKVISNPSNATTNLHLIQILNNYDNKLDYSEEKSNEYIAKLTASVNALLSSDLTAKLAQENAVSINPQLVLNTDKDVLTVEYSRNSVDNSTGTTIYQVYHTTENSITLTSSISGMLTAVYNFYGLGTSANINFNNYIKSNNDNLKIIKVELDSTNDKIVITYTAQMYSDNLIYITLAGMGAEDYDLGPIKILNATPSSIKYVDSSNGIDFTLSSTSNLESSSNCLQISVGYESSNYNITSKINGYRAIFNNNITSTTEDGFVGSNYTIDFDTITYTSLDEDIFTIDGTNLKPITTGTGVLQVEIGGRTAYLKVEVVADTNLTDDNKGFSFVVGGSDADIGGNYSYSQNYSGSAFNLSDFANLYYYTDYTAEPATKSTDLIAVEGTLTTLSNVKTVYYGDGEVTIEQSGTTFNFVQFVQDSTNGTYLLVDGNYVEIKAGTNTYAVDSTDPSGGYKQAATDYTHIKVGETYVEIQAGNTYKKQSVLTINKVDNNWKFSRANSQYVPITVSFDIVTLIGKINVTLTITSTIQVTYNSSFWTKEKTIYQNTTVEVFERAENSAASGDPVYDKFSKQAMLKVSGTSEAVEVKIYKDSTSGDAVTTLTKNDTTTNTSYKFKELGNYIFVVYVAGSKIQEIVGFKVVPNVIATYNSSYEWQSDTPDIDISSIFELKSFDLTDVSGNVIIYGSSDTYSYYNEGKLNPTESYAESEKLTISATFSNESYKDLITSEKDKFSIGWLQDINAKVYATITLNYNDDPIQVFNAKGEKVESVTAEITNKYSVTSDYYSLTDTRTEEINGTTTTYYILKALTEYDFSNILTMSDSSFSISGVTFTNGSSEESIWNGTKVYINVITGKYENAFVTFTFSNGTNTLTYTTQIFDIVPYTPTLQSESTRTALTNNYFDFFSSVFSDTVSSEVSSITMNGIYFNETTTAGETNLAEAILDSFEQQVVYSSSISSYSAQLNDEIYYSNNLIVKEGTYYVEYTIAYNGNLDYTFRAPITIKNRQDIKVNYPEAVTTNINTNFKFASAYLADGQNLGTQINNSDVFYINTQNVQFEPVLIYKGETTTIDFVLDSVKLVNRVEISNLDGSAESTNIASVNCIAYQNVVDFNNYFAAIECNVKVENNIAQVTLPSAVTGTNGYLIFKITTVSGNFDYYYVRVYCAGEANVNSSNSYQVNALADSSAGLKIDGTAITAVVAADSAGLLTTARFKEKFFKDYSSESISFYILSATALGDSAEYVLGTNNVRYAKLNETFTNFTNEFKGITKYTTVTIGIMYTSGVKQYSIGTITVYIQPVTHETLLTSSSSPALDSDITEIHAENAAYNTGTYTATIDNNATEIDCPFSVSGTTISNVSYYKNATDKELTTATDGKITLDRVSSDYTFIATYTYTNGLVLQVTYTYKATTLPNNTTISNVIGKFVEDTTNADNSYFEKEYTIDSKLLGNYKVEQKSETITTTNLKIGNTVLDTSKTTETELKDSDNNTISNVKYKYDSTNKVFVLVFTLTNTTQTIPLEFTYTGLSDTTTRTFTFAVAAGYTIPTVTATTNSGLTLSTSMATLVGMDYVKIDNDLTSSTYNTYKVNSSKDSGYEETTTDYTHILVNGKYIKIEARNRYNSSDTNYVQNDEGEYLLCSNFSKLSYKSAVGSSIRFNKVTYTNYTKYTIGGLVIYTHDNSSLDVSFNEEYALASETTMADTSTTPFNIALDGATINFVHLAQAGGKNLQMYIKVLTSDEQYTKVDTTEVTAPASGVVYYTKSGSTYTAVSSLKAWETGVDYYTYTPISYETKTMYITVQQTYGGIQAEYVTADADHENIVGGGSAISLYSYLFEALRTTAELGSTLTNIYNSTRMILLGTDYDSTNKVYSPTKATYSFIDMGFNMANNPNKMQFGLSGIGASLNNDKTQLTLGATSDYLSIKLYIANKAGVGSVSGTDVSTGVAYSIQIVPTTIESITLSNKNGYIGTGTDTSATPNTTYDYISYTTYDGIDLEVGTINDELIGEAFYLTAADLYKGSAWVGQDNLDKIEYTSTAEPFTKTYEIVEGNYTLTLTYNASTQQITCKFGGTLNSGSQVKFKLTLHGSTKKITENLVLVFTNLDIRSSTESTTDNSIYAGYEIDLVNDKKFTDSEGNAVSTTGLTLVLDDSSTYKVGGTTYTMSENTLFTYNSSNSTITTYSVGSETVNATLYFNVVYNSVVVKQLMYKFNVNRNLQLVANGGALANNINNNNLETNLYLDTSLDTSLTNKGEFELTYTIVSAYAGTAKTYPTTDDVKDNTKFRRLIINLYTIYDQYSTKSEYQLMKDNSNITIELHSNHADYVSISGKTITFKKDLNGDIELLVKVNGLNCGEYYCIWTIHVTGVRNFTYANADAELTRMLNSGSAFTSGTEVNIINSSTTGNIGVGILSSRPATFNSASGEVTVTINASYIKNSTDLAGTINAELFTLGTAISASLNNAIDVSDTNETLTLPTVPSSTTSNPQTYIVVYKISFSYLNKDFYSYKDNNIKDFYVAYQVVNYAQVEAASSSSAIDMDTGLVKNDGTFSATATENTFLDLFYYAETYDIGSGVTATLTYEKVDSNNQYVIRTTASSEYKYDTDSQHYKASGTDYFYFNNSGALIYNNGSDTTLTKSASINYLDTSVFKSGFSNIASFKEFIDNVQEKGYIQIADNNAAESTYYTYTLTHIANGRWGINLKSILTKQESLDSFVSGTDYFTLENGVYSKVDTIKVITPDSGVTYYTYQDTSSAYINNELVGDISVVENGVVTNSISAYNESTNTGFKLTTAKKLTPVGTTAYYVQDIFMPSEVTANGSLDKSTILSTRVLGVVKNCGKASQSWVKQGTTALSGNNLSLGSAVATINVAKDSTSYNTYYLKPVAYSNDAVTNGLYKLSQTFYLIETYSSSVEDVFVRDYDAVSIEPSYFKIAYKEGEVNQYLDTTNGAFKTYSMSESALTVANTTPNGNTLNTSGANIQIDSQTLIAEKAKNPTKTEYNKLYYVVTDKASDGTSVYVTVGFLLPDLQTQQVSYNSSLTELTASVVFDSTTFGGKAISDIESVVVDSEFADYVYDDGNSSTVNDYWNSNGITFNVGDDTSGIKGYFTTNSTATHLKLKFTMTFADSSTYTFYVVVVKSES